MTIGRDGLLAASKVRKRKLVNVPELGGELCFRELSKAELLEYNSIILPHVEKTVPPTVFAKAIAKLIVFSVCDEAGNQLYTEADEKDLAFNDLDLLRKLRQHIIDVSELERPIGEVADDLKKVPNGSSNTS